jgi:hypothetical protein
MFPARTTLSPETTRLPGHLLSGNAFEGKSDPQWMSVDAKPPRQPTKVLMPMMIVVVASGGRDHDTGLFVEQQLARAAFVAIVEVEHVVERSGDGIE